MKTSTIVMILLAILISGCTQKKETDALKQDIVLEKTNFDTVSANGYGESKEKAIEDAKNDALRQFGFNIVSDNNGKPELEYAGRIINFRVVSDFSEKLQNGMWWEIKIEADIQKL